MIRHLYTFPRPGDTWTTECRKQRELPRRGMPPEFRTPASCAARKPSRTCSTHPGLHVESAPLTLGARAILVVAAIVLVLLGPSTSLAGKAPARTKCAHGTQPVLVGSSAARHVKGGRVACAAPRIRAVTAPARTRNGQLGLVADQLSS